MCTSRQSQQGSGSFTISWEPHCTRGAGIQLHEGKTRTWNRGKLCVQGCSSSDQKFWSPCGIKILGTPVGSPEFAARLAKERLDEVVGRHTMRARLAMCVANPRPMRGTSLPPSDHATESARSVCPRPRRRHDVRPARAVGRTHWK